MFPIANARGEIIAFGGRAMGDASAEVPELARDGVLPQGGEPLRPGQGRFRPSARTGCFVLVEGYMDVMAMHQAGFANSVAPLGTALTEQQVRLLKTAGTAGRCSCSTATRPGRKPPSGPSSCWRAQDLLVQVAVVQGGKDPADLVQKGELEALRLPVDKPQDSFPYSLGKALAGTIDPGRAEGREEMRDLLFPFVAAAASPMRKDGYLAPPGRQPGS